MDGLVGFSKLAERSERVGAELVEDAWDKLGKLLDGACAIDGGCIRLVAGVYWWMESASLDMASLEEE